MRLSAAVLLLITMALPGLALDRGIGFSGGGFQGFLDPGTGMIRLYENLDGVMSPLGFSNFLINLELLRYRPLAEREGRSYSALRLGSPDWLPTGAQLLAKFPTTVPKEPADAKSYQAMATKMENDFWDKLPDYDGKASCAFQNPYLMVAIPGWHTLLLFEIKNRDVGPQLLSWRNIGPDIMIPQVYQSIPTPQDIFNQLPADLRTAYQDGNKTAAPPSPGKFKIASADKNRFVLIDPDSLHVVIYQILGKTISLMAARDCTMDMLIPTAFGKNATNSAKAMNAFVTKCKDDLQAMHFTPDLDEVTAYLEVEVIHKDGNDKEKKDSGADVWVSGNEIRVRDNNRRKLLSYKIEGAGNQLELVSMKDDTVDSGMALLEDAIFRKRYAESGFEELRDQIGKIEPKSALMLLRFVLKFEPSLIERANKDSRYQDLRKLPEWKELAETAQKDAADAKARQEARIKRGEELRKERAEREKKAKKKS